MLPTGVIAVLSKKWFFSILKFLSIELNKFVLVHRAALHKPTGHMGFREEIDAYERPHFQEKFSHMANRSGTPTFAAVSGRQ